MAQYHVIPHLTVTENGPVVSATVSRTTPQPVHLQQGALDGACGPYCLCMSLILLGIEKHTHLANLRHSETSKRLFSYISGRSSVLVTEGTYLEGLQKYAQLYKDKGLQISTEAADVDPKSNLATQGRKKNFTAVRDFVIDQVRRDRPVILGSMYHYALVIGLGYESSISDDEMPRYLLVLDPNLPPPKCCAWNGIIDIGVKGNNWFGTGGCTFEAAMALWRE